MLTRAPQTVTKNEKRKKGEKREIREKPARRDRRVTPTRVSVARGTDGDDGRSAARRERNNGVYVLLFNRITGERVPRRRRHFLKIRP